MTEEGKLKVNTSEPKIKFSAKFENRIVESRMEILDLMTKMIIEFRGKVSITDLIMNMSNCLFIRIRYCNESRRVLRVLGPVTFEMETIFDILKREFIGLATTDGINLMVIILLWGKYKIKCKIGMALASLFETANKKAANQIASAADWLIHSDTIHVPIATRDIFFADSNLKMVMEKHVSFTRNPWATYYNSSTTAQMCQTISTASFHQNVEKVTIMTGADDIISEATNGKKFEYELDWILVQLLSKVERSKILLVNIVNNYEWPEKSREFNNIIKKAAKKYQVLLLEPSTTRECVTNDGFLTRQGAMKLIRQFNDYGCTSIEVKGPLITKGFSTGNC